MPDELVLLEDERDDVAGTVKCRVCGVWLPYEKSRMFWLGGGTVRTCKKGLEPHVAGRKKASAKP